MSELSWYYGPTDWDREPGKMWHDGCPSGRGEVMYDGDGWAYCLGCKAVQVPEGDASICNATLTSTYGSREVRRCAREAGHYDETQQPDPFRDEPDPGGWHQSAFDATGNRTTWADWADGAKPHGDSPAEEQEQAGEEPEDAAFTAAEEAARAEREAFVQRTLEHARSVANELTGLLPEEMRTAGMRFEFHTE